MAKPSIQLTGIKSVVDKVKLLVPRVREGVKQTVAETALLIETDAKLMAPVDTGRLRASIHSEIAPNGLSAVVEAGVDYAIHVEYGTRYQRAQPFMFPAYEKNRLGFVTALKKNLKLF